MSECLLILSLFGVFTWKNETGAAFREGRLITYGQKGSADIIGLLPSGIFLAIEIKISPDKQKPEQETFERKVTQSNGVYLLVRDNAVSLVRYLREDVGLTCRDDDFLRRKGLI